ncbi:MAG: hypothetical protein V1720_01965 [bacterium]
MEAIFRGSIEQLNPLTIEKIKNLFGDNSIIEIRIKQYEDETDYLFSTESNRNSLEKSREQFNSGDFVIQNIEELGT